MTTSKAMAEQEAADIKLNDQLLDLCAVSRMTGMSEATVLRRTREGLFPAPIKIGTDSVRWIESELIEAFRRLPRKVWAPRETGRRVGSRFEGGGVPQSLVGAVS